MVVKETLPAAQDSQSITKFALDGCRQRFSAVTKNPHVSVLKITAHFSPKLCVSQGLTGCFAHHSHHKTQAAAASHHVRGRRSSTRMSDALGWKELMTSITAIAG